MGLLSGLGKLVGKVAPKILGAIPGGGTIKTAISVGGGMLKKAVRRNAKKIIAGSVAGATAAGVGARAVMKSRGGQVGMGVGAGGALGLMAGGMGGGGGFRGRRMNPGNTRAMRRAIRRIEAGARVYSKFFAVKHGRIKGAPGVRVKKLSIRRAA